MPGPRNGRNKKGGGKPRQEDQIEAVRFGRSDLFRWPFGNHCQNKNNCLGAGVLFLFVFVWDSPPRPDCNAREKDLWLLFRDCLEK